MVLAGNLAGLEEHKVNVLEGAGMLLAGIFGLFVIILYIGSIIWSFGDAEARGKSGCFVALLVAFLQWPFGLLAWIVFRPRGRNR